LPARRCFNCTLGNTWCSMEWRVSTQRGCLCRCFNCTLRDTWCSMQWRVSTQRMPSAYQKMLQLHTAQHLVQHGVACVNTANAFCLPEDASIAHCATLGAACSGVCQHSEWHLPTRRCFNC